MNEQLSRIKIKLKQLRKSDHALELFGSSSHRYTLNPSLDETDIENFEIINKIKLPKEYAAFITTLGNGGAGPYYGLEPLKNVLFTDLDYKDPDFLLNPAEPFPHSQPWNMEFTATVEEDENEEEYGKQQHDFHDLYYDSKYINGVIAICNYGCAISLNLVVNGPEYGTIWTDDRASDNGIYPSKELGNKDKIKFLDWYELWLDNSITEINKKKQTIPENKIPVASKTTVTKLWWKFW